MLSFAQFVKELVKDEITISSAEVRGMRQRFGDKTLQMGHLQEDGSIMVPTDCVLGAARSRGATTESCEALVERVGEARKRRLERMVDEFQAETDAVRGRQLWKQIERTIFGADYR